MPQYEKVNVRIPTKDLNELRARAERTGATYNFYIRKAVAEYLARVRTKGDRDE